MKLNGQLENAPANVLYFAVQSRFHRDSSGAIRTGHGYARYDAWRPYLEGVAEVILIARVSRDVSDTGEYVEGNRVRVLEVPHYRGPRDFLVKYGLIRAFIRMTLTDPGAIYGARVPDLVGSLVQRRARSIGALFFAQVVGDTEDVLRSGAFGKLGKILAGAARLATARQIRRADGVIYVTRRTLQEKYPAGEGKLTLSRSNVELDSKNFAQTSRDYEVRPPASPVRLITAGSQEQRYKGHDVLIDAVAILRENGVDTAACIVGGGKYHEELRRYAAERGVADLVEFTGQLAGAASVRERIAESDIFVLPSRTEGLSRVLIEAMASGIVCIGSSVGGTPELLSSSCLFESEDPAALADMVQRLVESPSTMSAEATASRLKASEIARDYSGEEILTSFLRDLRQHGLRSHA